MVYRNPRYYEIAFSFRDIAQEVDLLEESAKRYAGIPVKRFLDVGCGNAPHLEELARRGYHYTGIDTSEEMIEYARHKAGVLQFPTDLFHASMVEFQLSRRVDYAYVMLGSLYIASTEELNSHFDSMGLAINSGGLYLLDWCVRYDPLFDSAQEWQMEDAGTRVDVTFSQTSVNLIEQTFEETLELQVDDRGVKTVLIEQFVRRAIYPQEFLAFIRNRRDFEFIGWWNNWDLSRPLIGTEQIDRPIAIVRRI